MNVISEYLLKQILDAFFPHGYGRSDNSDGDYLNTFYLGWLWIGSSFDMPLEINLDGEGTCIVFQWYNQFNDEYSCEEIAMFILGRMRDLLPEAEADVNDIREDSHTLVFTMKQD